MTTFWGIAIGNKKNWDHAVFHKSFGVDLRGALAAAELLQSEMPENNIYVGYVRDSYSGYANGGNDSITSWIKQTADQIAFEIVLNNIMGKKKHEIAEAMKAFHGEEI